MLEQTLPPRRLLLWRMRAIPVVVGSLASARLRSVTAPIVLCSCVLPKEIVMPVRVPAVVVGGWQCGVLHRIRVTVFHRG